MPVRSGEDSTGPFYQWGESGRRYYYRKGSETSEKMARARAAAQGRAVRASGYRDDDGA